MPDPTHYQIMEALWNDYDTNIPQPIAVPLRHAPQPPKTNGPNPYLRAILIAGALLALALPYADLRARYTILRRHIDRTRPVVYILPNNATKRWVPGDPLPRIPGYNAPETSHGN
ncbi:MAG: hypothetical protein B7Z62_00250 [Deltaproteobacteria bacterium 37-65-8]|nr:MAG: hypothetical protein B7Z62_00250 [Deltaproteobacteria bacterium 37-65-8]